MYICICRSVSDHRIRQAAAEGARSLEDLQERLGVATGCGGCAEAARHCLREAREDRDDLAFQPQPA